MEEKAISFKIYIGLIIIYIILVFINIYLPQGNFLPYRKLPFSKFVFAIINSFIVFIFYGGLGFIGLKLSQKIGFTNIWDLKISNKQRFLIPALIGIFIGIFFIIADTILSRFHKLGRLPHPPFPTSIIASIGASIGEEIIWRLFFISFWLWFISFILLKKRWQNQIFWIISIISAFAFAFAHIPSFMFIFGFNKISEIPILILFEIIILNGVLSIFCAYYFRKFGFLASVGIHFWTDFIWHFIWGII
jgi:hypothetical protein